MANPTSRADMARRRPAGSDPGADDGPDGLPRTPSPSMLACEIAGFGDRPCGHRALVDAHKGLYVVLERSFTEAGVRWSECYRQDRGSGVLVIIPPAVPLDAVLDPLVSRVLFGLRQHNRRSAESARLTLRLAVTTGTVHFDAHGAVGRDLNRLFDLLKAGEFTGRFSDRTELGLVASEELYESAAEHEPDLIERHRCRPVNVTASGRTERAWTYFAERHTYRPSAPAARPLPAAPAPAPAPVSAPVSARTVNPGREPAAGGVLLDLTAFAAARRARC